MRTVGLTLAAGGRRSVWAAGQVAARPYAARPGGTDTELSGRAPIMKMPASMGRSASVTWMRTPELSTALDRPDGLS